MNFQRLDFFFTPQILLFYFDCGKKLKKQHRTELELYQTCRKPKDPIIERKQIKVMIAMINKVINQTSMCSKVIRKGMSEI